MGVFFCVCDLVKLQPFGVLEFQLAAFGYLTVRPAPLPAIRRELLPLSLPS